MWNGTVKNPYIFVMHTMILQNLIKEIKTTGLFTNFSKKS